jgi:hypothetical protein
MTLATSAHCSNGIPNTKRKVGLGIDHFSVMWAEGGGGKCFCVIRGDGTQIDFSYRHCIRSITNCAFAALQEKGELPHG